jgi:ATP-dependent DNA helicase RecG
MGSNLSTLPIQEADGVGPGRAKRFAALGISSISESLLYLPSRYEDRSGIRKISEVCPGCCATVKGRIISAVERVRKKISLFEITLHDDTGIIKSTWFNQQFMKKNFIIGQEVVLSGVVKVSPYLKGSFAMDSPEYEFITEKGDFLIHTNRVVPVYKLTEGISQKQFRKIMFGIIRDYLEDVEDPLPQHIRKRYNLPPLRESIRQVHFPEDNTFLDSLNRGVSIYQRRLVFDELFLFEVGMALLREKNRIKRGIAFVCGGRMRRELFKNIPFTLTDAQKKVIAEILTDMERPYPMRRLLQGDVGCGKTVVALAAIVTAVECGYQAALMAPTGILADQHYLNIKTLIGDLGVNVGLITGDPRDKDVDRVASGQIKIVVGTHALIQKGMSFRNLGLIVIDEQHKFGVTQRALLREKGVHPDVLVMTATPIPRSLAMTLYGDLDYSVIDELPPERKPVVTRVFRSDHKEQIYKILGDEIDKGRQVYVVYPSVEETDKADLKSAIEGIKAFAKIFPAFRVGLLHGRMNTAEKESIISSFKKGLIDILVTTTVVEVGVDVPNATLMLIVHAERFGLAQLHQLRGRVGRGAGSSYCLLITYGLPHGEAGRRLDAMVRNSDGFRVAEEDLAIRGPGEFFGTRQAGMPDLRVADIIRDVSVLECTKKEALGLMGESPGLEEFPSLRRALEVFWNGKADLFKTG